MDETLEHLVRNKIEGKRTPEAVASVPGWDCEAL
jgi:hypothetical protein